MLNLQARVHFQKVELSRGVRKQKLDRAGSDIIHRSSDPDRRRAHTLAQGLIVHRRRTLFNHFLMPPLNRAFTFAQMYALALGISEDLNLNMAGTLDEPFQIDFRIAESRGGFGLRSFKSGK